MNEALTRAQLIDPVLIDKGWKAGFCQRVLLDSRGGVSGLSRPRKGRRVLRQPSGEHLRGAVI